MRAVAALVLLATALVTGSTLLPASVGAAPTAVITLAPNAQLKSGESSYSPNRQIQLIMQVQGNLVLYAQGQALWSTPNRVPGARAIMQTDGNLVVYSPTDVPLWNSRTAGNAGAYATVSAGGDLAVLTATTTLWESGTLNRTLTAGHRLLAGQFLTGASGKYTLLMQTDGNLVLYGPSALWSTRTSRNPGAWAIMQTDGNMVVYSAANVPLFNGRTNGTGATALTNTDDGNVTVATSDGVAVFQAPTGTAGATIVAAAQSQRGKPYCWAGGNTTGPTKGSDSACAHTTGYDCSGLAMYAIYHAVGIVLPHNSGPQFSAATTYGGIKVARAALRPGDLVFFIGSGGSTAAPGHVGIYVGNNMMIDAQQSGVPVGLHTLYPDYVGAARYWH